MTDQKTLDRISRSISQPMYLLQAAYKEEGEEKFWAFRVEGFSGKQYKIHLRSDKGVKCACPDFQQRDRFCKHIFFIFCRILKKEVWAKEIANLDTDINIFDKFPGFVEEMSEAISRRLKPPPPKEEDDKWGDSCCPICFEKIEFDSWVCVGGCNYEFHHTCMEKYRKHMNLTSIACPMCRKEWKSLKRPRDDEVGPMSKLCKLKRA